MDKFWEKVHKTDGCWWWVASVSSNGYGKLTKNRDTHSAHRFSWEMHNGPIPCGMHVLHKCDNPLCVNPNHLFLGTNEDNMRDKCEKGRQVTPRGERNGAAKLTEEDVRFIRRCKGAVTRRTLANIFGVGPDCIKKIHRRETWDHV